MEHIQPWHERMTCTVCAREFWGACAFDAHLICGETTLRGKYVKDGELYIAKGDRQLYEDMKARAAKAREGKRK